MVSVTFYVNTSCTFVLKICSPMRPACERRALIVHEASDMDTEEQRSERTTAGRRQSIFRQRPQEHDEQTVSKVIRCCLTTVLFCTAFQFTFSVSIPKAFGLNTLCTCVRNVSIFTLGSLYSRNSLLHTL